MSKVNKKKMYNTIYDKIIAIMSSLIKLFYEQLGRALRRVAHDLSFRGVAKHRN